MIQSNFKIKLKLEEGEKEVDILMQEPSKFRVADVYAESYTVEGKLKVGTFLENIIPLVVISPKNLLEQINSADNAYSVMIKLNEEIQEFCDNPRIYKLKREEKSRIKQEDKIQDNK